MGDRAMSFAVGAVAGSLGAFIVWQLVKSQVDNQVAVVIDREVPPLVRRELDARFATLGINAAMAANLRTLLSNLGNLGLFSALASGTTPHT